MHWLKRWHAATVRWSHTKERWAYVIGALQIGIGLICLYGANQHDYGLLYGLGMFGAGVNFGCGIFDILFLPNRIRGLPEAFRQKIADDMVGAVEQANARLRARGYAGEFKIDREEFLRNMRKPTLH